MSQNSQLRFSIVIPCFNEGSYITHAIKSLKKQNFDDEYEIIIVDNNSTDKTAEIAKSLGVKVVSEKKAGVCYARQKGTEVASGEIIISTDADSTFDTNWLKNIDHTFKQSDDIVAVVGPFTYNGGPVWGAYADLLFNILGLIYKFTGRVLYSPAANLSFKKSAWEGYNTTMTQYGDEMDQLRKLRKKGKVVFKPNITVKTSARRLQKGLLYNIFISLLVYSILEYNLNRMFKRRFFGQAPHFVEEPETDKSYI
ncbi:MAG TPA: glycosyltransferase family 2 protein [Candidatus Saccharimonadales bacterium]|nr:glycosyltransferase family 2 protein [Candidatus Saccharimonadales bacterium]